jgi:hypothetical protein
MCKQHSTIDIRRQNKLLILLTFAACLSLFFITTISNQMHPQWLNLIAATLHAGAWGGVVVKALRY